MGCGVECHNRGNPGGGLGLQDASKQISRSVFGAEQKWREEEGMTDNYARG